MRHKLAFILLAVTTAFPVAAQNWTPRNGGANSASEGQRHRAPRAEHRAQPRAPAANRTFSGNARSAPANPNRFTQNRDGRRDARPGGSFYGNNPGRNLSPNRNDRGREYRPNVNDRGRWNNNWRNDRRYDWRGYRSSNRDRFRVPRYQAPRGYSYRRWSPGYRLQPFFYARSYWIMDPWQYRLPPAYGPYRWVRYYDDVLLVDITSGMVVDVIPDFFWN